ncbi:relaxase [Taibaiella sp. KBW10]|uniref:relaxase/mobilization nuclease domain-containing protein n=1 Tax=Taibaiella sp. KBW10 TaxID=2153357 RepID=UPI000F5A4128|nr:relaxase/mobilization nuclease domain-containing protein [Taibaiella sp. KBW10]RQO30400.1 relaxase [Taibaiella sp. KBW10]
MVAVINTGTSLRRSFSYNENKLREGVASLLFSENYPFQDADLTQDLRLKMLLKVAGLRPDVGVNAVHISLNFSPDELLSDEKMGLIAKAYMEQIGFGDQPYLVYRHHDSGHPHCHIVTTNVTMEAKRISLHHIGRLKSEPARKELEKKFGLVPAQGVQKTFQDPLKPIDVARVQYGKTDSKRAIEKVLNKVLGEYKFGSLHELNAVLGLYHVRADRGEKGSRIYERGGLVYRIIDETGKAVGVPIKASLFYNKPTLKYLDKLYLKNESDADRFKHQNRLKSVIDFAIMSKQPKSLDALAELLRREGINMVLRQSDGGMVYGITYVHFETKSVFNGSALGKEYSAQGTLERLGIVVDQSAKLMGQDIASASDTKGFSDGSGGTAVPDHSPSEGIRDLPAGNEKSLLELLIQYEYATQTVPNEWKKKNKKRRRL